MKSHFIFFLIFLSFIINQGETYEDSSAQKTLYIYRPLMNGDDLQHWAEEQGLTILPTAVLHVTLAYSPTGLENGSDAMSPDSNYFYNSDLDHLRHLDFFGKEKSVLVLKLEAPDLVERWKELKAAGAQWDWPLYEPHITLSYEGQEMDLEQITPYYGDLIFGSEVWIEID